MTYSEEIAIKIFKHKNQTRIVEKEKLKNLTFKNERLIYHLTEGFKLKWLMEIKNMNATEMSKFLKMDLTTLCRQLSMTLLAPDIIDAIMTGKQPVELSTMDFRGEKIPLHWQAQRKKYGFE